MQLIIKGKNNFVVFLIVKENLYHFMSLFSEEGTAANSDFSEQLEFMMTTLVSMGLLALLP